MSRSRFLDDLVKPMGPDQASCQFVGEIAATSELGLAARLATPTRAMRQMSELGGTRIRPISCSGRRSPWRPRRRRTRTRSAVQSERCRGKRAWIGSRLIRAVRPTLSTTVGRADRCPPGSWTVVSRRLSRSVEQLLVVTSSAWSGPTLGSSGAHDNPGIDQKPQVGPPQTLKPGPTQAPEISSWAAGQSQSPAWPSGSRQKYQ
jgi:hypothetical protein